jgi:uncharacterized protein YggU (UPF0235/DUF167 family)
LNGAGSPFRLAGGSVILAVRLTPKAGADKVESVVRFDGEPVLKARVRAVPEAGRANDALERLIADWLGVPPSSVTVAQGGKSRLKRVAVAGDADRLLALIETRLAALASPS